MCSAHSKGLTPFSALAYNFSCIHTHHCFFPCPQSISKRATALRVGLENYERKKYAEARRNFALAKRYGLNDEDVHYKDVHACTMVWQADPTTEGLESCRKAFEWLLQSVPSSQVGKHTYVR